MDKVCAFCKERFMCDRLLYACPRMANLPDIGKDELSEKDKADWAKGYVEAGYKVPAELEVYV